MQLYQLPHPLTILDNPPTKVSFKKLVKAKIHDYWEKKLRAEAALLPSLKYFNPQFMSLSRPHKLWTTAGNNPFEVAKARVQLLFLSNQYPCAKVSRHWSAENPEGLCTYPLCHAQRLVESREHILLYCPASQRSNVELLGEMKRVKGGKRIVLDKPEDVAGASGEKNIVESFMKEFIIHLSQMKLWR